MLSIWKEPDVA